MSTYRFGVFEFDNESGEVTGPSGSVRLQPQPARVLSMLLEANGRVVSREALRDRVWADTTVEFDQGLNFCIRQIRAALGDEANKPEFVETLPRRGYRFLIPIAPTAGRSPRRTKAIVSIVVIGIVVSGTLALRLFAGPFGQPVRLAILPFAAPDSALTAAGINGVFVDRLVESLTELENGRYGIIGPASTAALQARGMSIVEVGASLSTDYAMSGGIPGDTSRVFVQLIRVPNGDHVYARRFDMDTISIDRIHEIILADVADILNR